MGILPGPDVIRLLFTPEMEQRILEGKKIVTSRRERRPDQVPGRIFRVGDQNFIIVAGWWSSYHIIRDLLFVAEGFSSPEEPDQFFRDLRYPTDQSYYYVIVFKRWGDII